LVGQRQKLAADWGRPYTGGEKSGVEVIALGSCRKKPGLGGAPKRKGGRLWPKGVKKAAGLGKKGAAVAGKGGANGGVPRVRAAKCRGKKGGVIAEKKKKKMTGQRGWPGQKGLGGKNTKSAQRKRNVWAVVRGCEAKT